MASEVEKVEDLTLSEVTVRLGSAYAVWKSEEKTKNLYKDEFFERATDLVLEGDLDELLLTVAAEDEEAAIKRLEQYHPRHVVDEMRLADEQPSRGDFIFEAILVERPEFKQFSFVNAEDGMVYTKQVQEGGTLVDDDRMKAEDPDLYERITFTLPWGTTIVRPLDKVSGDDLAAIQTYLYRGKPVVKLAAPKRATEEELAELDEGDD